MLDDIKDEKTYDKLKENVLYSEKWKKYVMKDLLLGRLPKKNNTNKTQQPS